MMLARGLTGNAEHGSNRGPRCPKSYQAIDFCVDVAVDALGIGDQGAKPLKWIACGSGNGRERRLPQRRTFPPVATAAPFPLAHGHIISLTADNERCRIRWMKR
jgi:hypothetical protein